MPADPPRRRATRPALVAGKASRSLPAGCRPGRRHGPNCKPNSSHHAREAGRIDRSGRSSQRRRHDRSQAHATGRTRRWWRPNMRRSAQKSAPPQPSGRSEGISATAGASANPSPSTRLANHAQGEVSRFGSRQTDIARGEIWIHAEANIEITCCRRCCGAAHAPRSPPEPPTPLPGAGGRKIITPKWRNPDHFAYCSNFEQSLLKLVTRRKRWSTTAFSGRPQG